MKYFVKVPAYYSAHKNKLDQQIQELAKKYDRYVFDPSYLEVVKSSLQEIIKKLSEENKRCAAVTSKWSEDTFGHHVKALPNSKFKDWTLWLQGGLGYHVLELIICREDCDL